MNPASFALQKSVYEWLAANPDIRDEIGDPPRLYDEPPSDAAFPYVVLGETRVSKVPGWPGGAEHDLRFSIYSRHAGRRDVKRILGVLVKALHEADFPLEGAILVNCRFVFGEIFRRDLGDVFEGLARFRVTTEAA